jgi:hypothetical protein
MRGAGEKNEGMRRRRRRRRRRGRAKSRVMDGGNEVRLLIGI